MDNELTQDDPIHDMAAYFYCMSYWVVRYLCEVHGACEGRHFSILVPEDFDDDSMGSSDEDNQ